MSLLCPTVHIPCPQFVGFGRYGHTKLPVHTYQNQHMGSQFQHVLTNANLCCVLRYKFHVFKLYGSGDMVTQNYQCVQNHETWFTSRTHSSNYDGVVTMLDYVLINLNLCCIQWYKFRVCRGKGSRDTVTQIYSCDQNHEKWFISRAHSSISNGMSHYFYIPL